MIVILAGWLSKKMNSTWLAAALGVVLIGQSVGQA